MAKTNGFLEDKVGIVLSLNAIRVLESRYLLKDDHSKIIESPAGMFRRVAKAIAAVERKYGVKDYSELEDGFYEMMSNLEFLPNSPTLMNAGTKLGQLSACFVVPVEDHLVSIFDAVKIMALIHQSGGGTGFSFSKLRPKGDMIKSTNGVASGPVSFMSVFDTATNVIKQGGKRRGANMGILSVRHPDILDFINAKLEEGKLSNFNISVGVDDKFMKAVKRNGKYNLINPRNGSIVGKLRAKEVFNLIVKNAWKTGDPGIVFLDEINRKNVLLRLGRIEATNPCAEQPLLDYESCNLGSLNLVKFVDNGKINLKKLKDRVRKAVHFLDNVIDANKYIMKEIEVMSKANRKIGLGIMGWAECLIELGIPYNSDKALKLAGRLMSFINKEARKMSVELGKFKGSFPNFKKSDFYRKYRAMRNATVTTIAPTGTISIIAGCSSGIEPLFAISFIRKVMNGNELLEVNKRFEEVAKEKGFDKKGLMLKVAKSGGVQHIKDVPNDVKKIFVNAFDIKPEWHVKMQAAFQKHVDNAVSKTVNLKKSASVKEIEKIYKLAYKLKCKGITIYRYGCKENQVLYLGRIPGEKRGEEYAAAESEYAGGCPAPYCPH